MVPVPKSYQGLTRWWRRRKRKKNKNTCTKVYIITCRISRLSRRGTQEGGKGSTKVQQNDVDSQGSLIMHAEAKHEA
jgi:hypothetical protein